MMKTPTYQSILWYKPIVGIVIALLMMVAPFPVSAQSMIQADVLQGDLVDANSAHYLALQPAERDGTVTLTLLFGDQNDQRVAGKVGFWILSASGLRDFQAGVKANEVAIAGSNPVSGKDDDYLRKASFTAVGRQLYTVIVYSDAPVSVFYELSANNALLIDHTGQTRLADATQDSPVAVQPSSSTNVSVDSTSINDATTKIGDLAGRGQQIYFTIRPSERDGSITINMDYDPKNFAALNGQISFYVFSRDGLRDLSAGERPNAVNLASGTLVKEGETLLRATFQAVDTQPYTVMLMNRANSSVTYTLKVSGGSFQ